MLSDVGLFDSSVALHRAVRELKCASMTSKTASSAKSLWIARDEISRRFEAHLYE